MAIPLAKRVQTAYIYRCVLSFCSVGRMPLPFTRGDILAESNEQKRPPRRAAAARACADAGVIGVYCVGCGPWVRVCAPVAAECGRRAETVFRRVFIGRREQAVFGKGAGRNAVVLFPRAGYRVFAGLCVHRHCGGTARVCVPGVSSIVLAVLLCALARAGELSVAAGAVRHPASGGAAVHAAARERVA